MVNHVMPMLDAGFAPVRALPDGMPILYEDEEEGDMGESNLHVKNDEILHVCVKAHLSIYHPKLQAYSNMNLYYLPGPPHPQTGALPYVSPDHMIVGPPRPLPEDIKSYTIGRHGPVPVQTGEILSQRSAQQRDLAEKMVVYAMLRVEEYILVDETGQHLREMLLLKRLQGDGSYRDERDPDGGVTSKLGFRLVMEEDGLHVIDQATRRRYVRPLDAERRLRLEEDARRRAEGQRNKEARTRKKEEEARRQVESQLRAAQAKTKALEEELRRLRRQKKSPE